MSYRQTDNTQELEDLRKENEQLKAAVSGMVRYVGMKCPVCNTENWHYPSNPGDNRRSLNRVYVSSKPAFRRWGFLWKVPAQPAHVKVNCTFCNSTWVEFPPEKLQSG